MALRIRDDQLGVFRPAADAEFERRVAEHLRDEHADAPVMLPDGERPLSEIPDDVLLRLIRRGAARARAYGMTWESSLTAFVVLMFVVAPNFDAHPLIGRVLADEQTPPDERLEQLWEQTTDENWEAAQENYDERTWELDADEGSPIAAQT